MAKTQTNALVDTFRKTANTLHREMSIYSDRVDTSHYIEFKADGSLKDLRVRLPAKGEGDPDILPKGVQPISDKWVSESYQALVELASQIEADIDAHKTWIEIRKNNSRSEVGALEFLTEAIDPIIEGYVTWNAFNEVEEQTVRCFAVKGYAESNPDSNMELLLQTSQAILREKMQRANVEEIKREVTRLLNGEPKTKVTTKEIIRVHEDIA